MTVFLFKRGNLYTVRSMDGEVLFKGDSSQYIAWRRAHSSYEVIK